MSIKLFAICLFLGMALSQAQKPCCTDSTVTVNGNGKAYGAPDIATFTITISETASTTQQASDAANAKTNQALSILASNGVLKKDVQTTGLNISPQYDWNNGSQTLRGQQASQTINVKLRNIGSNGTVIGSLIDALSVINNINLSGISFDINDKSALNKQAREKAFNDAKTKAQQYAQLSGMRLADVLTVSDNSFSNQPIFFAARADSATSTPVAVGQV